MVGESPEPGVLGKLRIYFKYESYSPPGVLVLSPPPFSSDPSSFRYISWFRSLLPLLNRYFLAFDTIEFIGLDSTSFQGV